VARRGAQAGLDIRLLSTNIAAVGAAVRAAGNDRTIVNEMTKEIKAAAKPLRPEIRANAVQILPHRGGLGAWVAKAAIRVAVKRGTRAAGVTLVGSRSKGTGKKAHLRSIEDGLVRVPVNRRNRRGAWREQAVPSGFMSEVVEEHGDEFRAAIVVAVDRAMRQVGL
jgi:ketopantoate reductase